MCRVQHNKISVQNVYTLSRRGVECEGVLGLVSQSDSEQVVPGLNVTKRHCEKRKMATYCSAVALTLARTVSSLEVPQEHLRIKDEMKRQIEHRMKRMMPTLLQSMVCSYKHEEG